MITIELECATITIDCGCSDNRLLEDGSIRLTEDNENRTLE